MLLSFVDKHIDIPGYGDQVDLSEFDGSTVTAVLSFVILLNQKVEAKFTLTNSDCAKLASMAEEKVDRILNLTPWQKSHLTVEYPGMSWFLRYGLYYAGYVCAEARIHGNRDMVTCICDRISSQYRGRDDDDRLDVSYDL